MDRLEKDLCCRFSEEYRNFLLKFNGGIPSLDIVDVHDAPDMPTDVQIFFGIGTKILSSDIRWNLNVFRNRLNEMNYIPIACDSGGNLFCIKIENAIAEEIWYYDMSYFDCKSYFVSYTFLDFIKKIQ